MKTSRRDFLTMAAAAVASLVIPKAARAETDEYQAQRGGLHITIKAMDNQSGAMQDTAHAFDNLGRELYLNDVRQAFVRGSRLIADNIGATLPPLRAAETDQDVGRSLVQAFDLYANENDIDPCEADSIREDIRDTWGLRREMWMGHTLVHDGARYVPEARRPASLIEILDSSENVILTAPPGATIVGVDKSAARPSPWYLDDFITAATERFSRKTVDNLGLTIDVGYVSYMAALSKGKLVDSLTESEKRQAFMNELLSGGNNA